ncbi:MAG TPA: recombination mediator RecR [Cyclobacteriaceae bacterium]|nr:recombination mediator RecR [Cyclobacteriaceae bacterium]MCB9237536.1 recombination protein RecR [Flammeovirgaceae bacterium]MCB0500293.1 recombination protein RecR [Cyclobacteriaceae bacterium]MCO5270360.1 recombination mediator RecR [Cyclobacteriaceae bacterium]MCW5903532.1 recombination mediator RecR [Cyclobacteriaceae bacterium]
MEYPSKLIEEAVNEVSKLPGIGKKTALRLVLHLVKENETSTFALTAALNKLRSNIVFCKHCHNISDEEVCSICRSHRRDRSMLCVVEETVDVLAIENTSQYYGLYHVLGGVISPMNGIGPSELKIESLLQRVSGQGSEVKEVILALSPTMEGDTTAFYVSKRLKGFPVKLSSIARGIPIGGDLEYADEITLGRSILARTLFN